MLDAIRVVFAGRPSIPAEIAMQIARHVGADSLGEREVEVLRLREEQRTKTSL
jgi:DNA-binding NarL/FixJ family response regulator